MSRAIQPKGRSRPIGARRRLAPNVRRGPTPQYQALALEPAIDSAKLEQLIAADERRQSREAAVAFARDLAEMAGELPVLSENGEIRVGQEVVSTYVLWEDLNEAIRPVLFRWGFVLSFNVESTPNQISVSARLMHRSGHVEVTTLTLPPDPGSDRNPIQAIASAISYAKRYTASALLNLTSRGEDDDGRAAGPVLSSEQLAHLEAKILSTGANRLRLLEYLGAPSLGSLLSSRFEEAIAALDARAAEEVR